MPDVDRPDPTAEQILALVAFIPYLEDPPEPFMIWGDRYPIYSETINQLFREMGAAVWMDSGYNPSVAGKMAVDPDRVDRADWPELRQMITWCVRGERFSDGFQAHILQEGIVLRILHRVQALC